MKLKFKEQKYQLDAVNYTTRIFAGQTRGQRIEVVGRTNLFVEEVFSNKKIEIKESEILKNIQEIQRDQGLDVVQNLRYGLNFTVEMETGTGKTYVYIRTMFELYKQYGWNKYIVMVPSVAIREGVNKAFEITQDHFQEIYGKKIRFFIYDTKNKSNIANIQNFGNSADIEVIIMNYQAFASSSQEARKIFQKLDAMQSQKPIEAIKRTRPILIIDEPQRFGIEENRVFDYAGVSKAAKTIFIEKEFNQLFTLMFSATHKMDFNKIYRLDAIDAFNQKLVKKIKVKGIEVNATLGTSGYLFLERINIYPDRNPTATIEIEISQQNNIAKHLRVISEGDNLFSISNEMTQYMGYIVREINAKTGLVSFTNGESIKVGQIVNDLNEEHVRRIQIRETIKSHIEKEKELFKKGIKTLSLFFIDEVSKYRKYDDLGNQIKSEYEEIFESEYQNILARRELFNKEYYEHISKYPVEKIHNGYFSIDGRGRAMNPSGVSGESNDASAYELIMKNKERLLSLEEPVRFIFSHSALREGWDNPNIFQICTLKHSDSTISKRQEIGRGLRIAVNNNGERMDWEFLGPEFFDINALTVIASESYDSFAKQLQKEILDSVKGRPTKLEVSVLKDKVFKNKSGEKIVITESLAQDIIFAFRDVGYIDDERKITEELVKSVDQNNFIVPETLENFKEQIADFMMGMYATNTYKPTENELSYSLPKVLNPNENFAKKEFQELWEKLKVKTTYSVSFDTEELIKNSVEAINKELHVQNLQVVIETGVQTEKLTESILQTGEAMVGNTRTIEYIESALGMVKYDIIANIAKNTYITRRTVAQILSKISNGIFAKVKKNPEDFIKKTCRIINEQKATTLINKITYHRTQEKYTDDIFTINNFEGSSMDNIIEVKRHIYDYIKTDSRVERTFAQALEESEQEIIVYAKLPSGFVIPTPIGNYNPDWAIVFNQDDIKHVYFIAETKGSMSSMQLKKMEELKIKYAKKHFELFKSDNIKYDVVSTYEDLRQKII